MPQMTVFWPNVKVFFFKLCTTCDVFHLKVPIKEKFLYISNLDVFLGGPGQLPYSGAPIIPARLDGNLY